MAAPAFPIRDVTRTPHQPGDLARPERRHGEAGTWHDNRRHDLQTCCFPAVVMVVDTEFVGTNDGTLTVTITPTTTASGSAAGAGMAPASISIVLSGNPSAATQVQAVIDEIVNRGSITALTDIDTWQRFRSYVTPTISPTGATHLRLTAAGPTSEFSVAFTGTAIDAGNTATQTAVTTPSTETLKVGTFIAIDRAKGTNGLDPVSSNPWVKPIEASTPQADIIGPVHLGNGTLPLSPGWSWREYAQGSTLAVALYGHMLAWAEKIIPAASVGTPVYVRHTLSGTNIPGLPTDAAGAALGATANLWTGTPTPANDTWFQMSITIGAVVETLRFLSDVAATDIEINDGLRADLLTKTSLTGLVTGSGTTTLILTGPADGRAFTPVDVGPGVMALVETTPEVSTHTKLTRGDTWLTESVRIGSCPVSVPHSNA